MIDDEIECCEGDDDCCDDRLRSEELQLGLEEFTDWVVRPAVLDAGGRVYLPVGDYEQRSRANRLLDELLEIADYEYDRVLKLDAGYCTSGIGKFVAGERGYLFVEAEDDMELWILGAWSPATDKQVFKQCFVESYAHVGDDAISIPPWLHGQVTADPELFLTAMLRLAGPLSPLPRPRRGYPCTPFTSIAAFLGAQGARPEAQCVAEFLGEPIDHVAEVMHLIRGGRLLDNAVRDGRLSVAAQRIIIGVYALSLLEGKW